VSKVKQEEDEDNTTIKYNIVFWRPKNKE